LAGIEDEIQAIAGIDEFHMRPGKNHDDVDDAERDVYAEQISIVLNIEGEKTLGVV
jgi:hypothetical protein